MNVATAACRALRSASADCAPFCAAASALSASASSLRASADCSASFLRLAATDLTSFSIWSNLASISASSLRSCDSRPIAPWIVLRQVSISLPTFSS